MRNATFFGTLGRDWATKTLDSGKSVMENSLAVNTGKDSTLWVKLSFWNEKRFDTLSAWAKKGDRLCVQGDVDCRAYMGKDGEAKAEMSCRVNDFTPVFNKKSDDAEPAKAAKVANVEENDEIPF